MSAIDELAALRAVNEQLRRRCAQMTANMECWTDAFNGKLDELEADNKRLRSAVTQWRAIAHAAQESYAKLKVASEELLIRCEEPPTLPSGPSWLERVAAGPQRIGIPLP